MDQDCRHHQDAANWLKPSQGLKEKMNAPDTRRFTRLKSAETLSGIETKWWLVQRSCLRASNRLKPSQGLKQLWGDESRGDGVERSASNRLKPSQGLKQLWVREGREAETSPASNRLKPSQGLKPKLLFCTDPGE